MKNIFLIVFFVVPAVVSFYKSRIDIGMIFIVGLAIVFILEKRRDLVNKFF